MSKNSMPTVLIPAQQWARRSGNRRGSVACTEQGRWRETILTKPSVRASRVWLNCIVEDETQWGVNKHPASHGSLGDVSTLGWTLSSGPFIRQSRRAFSEKVNGVKSQPNHDASSHSVNSGSPKLVAEVNSNLYGDGVPIVPKSQPHKGMTAGSQSGSDHLYKSSAMVAKASDSEGKWNSFCAQLTKRKEDC